ncbi:helix-turn-helix domain-containing protein [Paraburkholderia dinghuensis]|uniref:Helix-turn-helix domain-containing protein n=1 Tax=Paraburkholderia dinghuensis TaxID=2305225 RepID=A0A3N6PZA7_9BURK|nr:helix-turn-helix domain-containing protein [Paraburkholderia dinghuensis]RQH07840.1 helix-turn-helix domain-containing protein [Paraburkholderia dinghuensis]
MSEPQHPFGTDTNAGRPAPGSAPSPVQPVPDTMIAAGARLAQLREAKGWAVEDVSARLKVSVQKLRSLEAGDLTHLPDTTFALGVVRSYAKMLGADPTPFTQALRRERGMPEPDLSMPASAGSDLPRGRVSLTLGGNAAPRHRSWLWGVAAVIVAVIAISMWHTNSGESSAWFARLKSMANGAPAQPGGASATVAEGQTAGAAGASTVEGDQAQTSANAQASDAAAGTEAAAPADAAPAAAGSAPQAVAPVAPAAAASAPSAAVVSTPKAPAAATPAASEPVAQSASAAHVTPTADASGADTSTFAIRVTQDTWVNVRQKDGKEVFSGMVRGSDAREITGTEPLKITVGNKAGIESMTIDGQPVDSSKYASARGNVARFVLP